MGIDLRHLLGRIIKISSGFLCGFDAFREVDPGTFQSPLRKSSQFLQFPLFGIQLTGTVQFQRGIRIQSLNTHLCAWFASDRSIRMGSKALFILSLNISTTSIPLCDP